MNRRAYLWFCGGFTMLGILLWLSTIWLTYTINLTNSLPGTLYVIHKGEPVTKGDLVAYRWHGGATYPRGTMFIKRVVGLPGDMVWRDGTTIWVNDALIGVAKPKSKAGVPLAPAEPGVIGDRQIFVATPSPHSLDSRYALSGNIRQEVIVGRAYAIF